MPVGDYINADWTHHTAMEQKGIKNVYWNLQSLLNKTDSVRLVVNELSPDILCASETWLKLKEEQITWEQ